MYIDFLGAVKQLYKVCSSVGNAIALTKDPLIDMPRFCRVHTPQTAII